MLSNNLKILGLSAIFTWGSSRCFRRWHNRIHRANRRVVKVLILVFEISGEESSSFSASNITNLRNLRNLHMPDSLNCCKEDQRSSAEAWLASIINHCVIEADHGMDSAFSLCEKGVGSARNKKNTSYRVVNADHMSWNACQHAQFAKKTGSCLVSHFCCFPGTRFEDSNHSSNKVTTFMYLEW